MSSPRIGSLASGYGGLDMAVLEVFGGHVVWHLEYDPAPSRILAHHYPGIPNHGDITTTDWTQVEPIDVLIGGYPCQPFSHAGKRKGVHDDRHIWPWIADAIRVLRPRVAVFENVAGHLGLGFDAVLADLAALGMDVRWGLVRASDAGAPHRRERLFIVATDPDRPGLEGRPVLRERGQQRAVGSGGVGTGLTLLPTPRAQNAEERNNLIWERPADQPQNLENALAHALDAFGPYAPAIARWEAVLGRPAPSPTEPGKDGRPRLSPRFVEWMMGLPAGHVTDPAIGLTRAQQLKACGNGVCPQQAILALSTLLGLAVAPTLPTLPTLPTPTVSEAKLSDSGPDYARATRDGSGGDDLTTTVFRHLLPTPAVNDMGEGKTPADWDQWTAWMRAAHGNGNGHDKSLAIEALRLGDA